MKKSCKNNGEIKSLSDKPNLRTVFPADILQEMLKEIIQPKQNDTKWKLEIQCARNDKYMGK